MRPVPSSFHLLTLATLSIQPWGMTPGRPSSAAAIEIRALVAVRPSGGHRSIARRSRQWWRPDNRDAPMDLYQFLIGAALPLRGHMSPWVGLSTP
jgi:hypothetical protein